MTNRDKITEIIKQKGRVTSNEITAHIRIKLFTTGGIHVSRSQARRVLVGLEKFKIVLFDYENVPMVGQAFADEIYRVFQESHPDIRLENEHMSEGVRFMVERAKNEAKKINSN